MTTKIISIGNSKGVRIPKAMIKQYELDEGNIELKAKANGILISPLKKSRIGWEDQLAKGVNKKVTKEDDNVDINNSFDETDWTW